MELESLLQEVESQIKEQVEVTQALHSEKLQFQNAISGPQGTVSTCTACCVCVCVCLGVIRKQKKQNKNKGSVGYLSILPQVCQTKISIFIIFYMLV